QGGPGCLPGHRPHGPDERDRRERVNHNGGPSGPLPPLPSEGETMSETMLMPSSIYSTVFGRELYGIASHPAKMSFWRQGTRGVKVKSLMYGCDLDAFHIIGQ